MKRNKSIVLLVCNLFATSYAISSQWSPLISSYPSPSIPHQEASVYGNEPFNGYSSLKHYESIPESHPLAQQEEDQCALYKVGMTQQLYFEYIHYKTDLPDLKEFTLCSWMKFHNHTNDHPIFSYAVDGQPRAILSWIANTARSSYFMLNINGHNLYRLNYPLRLNKWYHSCQSWNGRTGEWQIWVNDERVGRGFHNTLVGHTIKGGGIAITGQEQRQLGGGFLEGDEAPPGSGGFLGEITMLQLYNVALTAGKAHKDHKHHHAHHYEHNTNNNTPQPTTQAPVTGRPIGSNAFLTAGQINHRVKINTGSPVQVNQNGLTLRYPVAQPATSFLPLPPTSNEANNQLPSVSGLANVVPSQQFFGNQIPQISQFSQVRSPVSSGYNGFADAQSQFPNLFKREVKDEVKEEEAEKVLVKRDDSVASESEDSSVDAEEIEAGDEKVIAKRDSEKKKRGLVQLTDGSIIEDTFLANQGLETDYLSGLAHFGLQVPTHQTKPEEREPAEAEVARVMNVCDGCAPDPFEKALVMGWRTVPKKLYSGALYLPAAQTCKGF